MDKERLFIVILFCVFLSTNVFGQRFNYNSQKKQNSEYNEELAVALRNNDNAAIGRILKQDPSLANAASGVIETSKRLRIKTTVPLICDAVQKCLNGQCSVQVVETILSYNPNISIKFDGLPPFYMILNYLACHKIKECGRAEELFFVFLNKSNIDIREKPADLPLSFSYLLTENYNYLNKQFSKDYISPKIIKAFVDKGASINTKDTNSNSILSFATLTQNQELVDYCIKNGADLASKNKEGKDAFYYAVANKDYATTKNILDNGYQLSFAGLVSMNMKNITIQAGNDIQNLLFDRLKNQKMNISDMQALFEYFPNQKSTFLSTGFKRSQLDITRDQLASVIDMYTPVQLDKTGKSNLESFKKEYIETATNLKSFDQALKKYSTHQLNYSDNYYEKETTYNSLLSELNDLKHYYSPESVEKHCKEARERQRRFVESDWKGNAAVAKKVVTGYPELYNKVVNELYSSINAIYISSVNYDYDNTDRYMNAELNDISREISMCDAFIREFGNTSYAETARNKRAALVKRQNYVSYTLHNGFYRRLSDARDKYYQLKKYILEQGPTPQYSTSGWDTYTDFWGEKFDTYDCEVEYGSYRTLSLSIKYCHGLKGPGGYEINKRTFFGTYVGTFKNLNEGIRKSVWEEKRYDDYDNNSGSVINFVEFLEKNKNGAWWKYSK